MHPFSTILSAHFDAQDDESSASAQGPSLMMMQGPIARRIYRRGVRSLLDELLSFEYVFAMQFAITLQILGPFDFTTRWTTFCYLVESTGPPIINLRNDAVPSTISGDSETWQ